MLSLERPVIMTAVALSFSALTSCDKVSGFVAEAKRLAGIKASSDIDVVTEAEAKDVIDDESRLVVVEYYMEDSTPCQVIAPVLDGLAVKNAELVRIVKVDADKEKAWAQEQGVKGVPAFQFYKDGELVDNFVGSIPKGDFQKKIEYYSLSEESREGKAAPERSIQPLPKDWLPPGVSKG